MEINDYFGKMSAQPEKHAIKMETYQKGFPPLASFPNTVRLWEEWVGRFI